MPNAEQKRKLTKTLLESLEPEPREYSIWDTAVEGFHVRVLPTGRKSFSVFYRFGGRQKRRSIGSFPTITVGSAREHARDIITNAKRGIDPFQATDEPRAVATLADLWTLYWTTHAIVRKAERSQKEDERLWFKHIAGHLGDVSVEAITFRHLSSLQIGLIKTPIVANRVIALLSTMFSIAIKHDLRHDNPCRGIEHFPETKRKRYLSEDELIRLTAAIDEEAPRSPDVATLLRLLLLTGARKSELLRARWEEFDLVHGQWTVPREHIKGGRRNDIHLSRKLSALAVSHLRDWQTNAPNQSPYVFPSPHDATQHRKGLKRIWDRVRTHAGLKDLTLHDLRHTYGTIALAKGHSLDAIGKNMGHLSPMTTRRYAHVLSDAADAVSEAVAEMVGNTKTGVGPNA